MHVLKRRPTIGQKRSLVLALNSRGLASSLIVTALETATMSHVTTSEVGIKPPLLALTWTFSLQLCILSTNRHYASPLRPLFLCCHIIQSLFPSLPGTAFKNILLIYRRYLQFKNTIKYASRTKSIPSRILNNAHPYLQSYSYSSIHLRWVSPKPPKEKRLLPLTPRTTQSQS
jgi:hypothetical protein